MEACVAAAVAIQTSKHVIRALNDGDPVSKKPENIRRLQTATQVLAWLVYLVIFFEVEYREKHGVSRQQVSDWLSHLGYEEVDFATFLGHGDPGEGALQKLGRLFRKTNQAPKHGVKNLPDYVFAIRGTRGFQDSWNNAGILLETLAGVADAFQPVVDLILEVNQQNGSVDKLCIAGHSQGAYLALLGARKAALIHGIAGLSLHLFNPPFVSLDVLAEKGCAEVFNGLSTIPSKLGRPGIGLYVRDIGSTFTGVLQYVAEKGTDRFSTCRNKRVQMTRDRETLRERRLDVHLYINEKDPICNAYLPYFRGGARITSSSATCVCEGSRSMHLIGMIANVHINNEGNGVRGAHRLVQWTRF